MKNCAMEWNPINTKKQLNTNQNLPGFLLTIPTSVLLTGA
jgi:hypothetical protein